MNFPDFRAFDLTPSESVTWLDPRAWFPLRKTMKTTVEHVDNKDQSLFVISKSVVLS